METDRQKSNRKASGSIKRAATAALTAAVIFAMSFSCGCASQDDGREWTLSSFGNSVDNSKVEFDRSIFGKQTLSTSGSGKLAGRAADGLSFFYTEIDADENFVLSGTVKVENWTLTNGEDDGFGIMAADSVGKDGDSSTFLNNSYMAAVTKSVFCWNKKENRPSNTGDEIAMKLGVIAQKKTGNRESHPADIEKAAKKQTTEQFPLETSQAGNGPGTYNVIGNYDTEKTGKAPEGTVSDADCLTEIPLKMQRDSSGYTITYTDPDGKEHSKSFADEGGNDLAMIDKGHIYVGLFCTGTAEISCSDLELVTGETEETSVKSEPEIIDPDYRVLSADSANSADYDLIFRGNADGKLIVSAAGQKGTGSSKTSDTIAEQNIKADETYHFPVSLSEGKNDLSIRVIPGKDYSPGKGKVMSDLSPETIEKTVTYRSIGQGTEIYAAPNGTSSADGTAASPLDAGTAFSFAAPGQTVILKQGKYLFDFPAEIPVGHSGTKESPVQVRTEGGRAVFDFQKRSAGIIIRSDYWDISGVDVTNTASGEYGIHICGSHNLLERVDAYSNGNTGFHISTPAGQDEPLDSDRGEWPSYNTIKNCDSYGNADDGLEDADGFAAQFTAGPGNVFDGCTAYNNADDGWDLYAKVWIGPVGPVTIKNCAAYRNGYLEDGSRAGDGNGFKLGGDGMAGGHKLLNSIAYGNAGCGITSNSCPYVTIKDCTSADNDKQNIALYGRDVKDTDFAVSGIISTHTDQEGEGQYDEPAADLIEPLGKQDSSKLFGKTNYYYKADKNGTAIDPEKIFESTSFDPDASFHRAKDGTLSTRGGFLRTRSGLQGYPGLRGASL